MKLIINKALNMLPSNAIVSYSHENGVDLNWKYESVNVREELKDNEVLVEMSSVGLCHTDIVIASLQVDGPPKILGHEGCGFVKKIGSKVSNCVIGDRVLLSFDFCKLCSNCLKSKEAYCREFNPLNLENKDSDVTFKTSTDETVLGKFFGQSSFSKYSVVSDSCIVNLRNTGVPDDAMDVLGPFGCGFQTGAGAIINAAGAAEGESCVVYGLGGVGLAAIMAAKVAGCSPIIGVDLLETKLEKAKSVGATHVIKPGTDEDVHNKIREFTGNGADISFECIGGPRFVQNAVKNAAPLGRIVYVGVGGFEDTIQIPLFPFMSAGKQLIGCIEGNATPSKFIPKMIEWYLNGQFPIEQIETQYPVQDFEKAILDVKSGKTIKAILKF